MKKTVPHLEAPLFREPCFIDQTEEVTDPVLPDPNGMECLAPQGADVGFQSDGQAVLGVSSRRAACALGSAQRASIRLYGWMEALVSAVLLVLFLFLFVVRVISIDGSSMLPTLKDRDFVLVTAGLLSQPRQGDVLVLRKSSFMADPIVKRVIATEGQQVDIDFKSGMIRVDGKLLQEPYILEKTHQQYDVAFPVTVPEGCVFVLGDNRNESTDSRYSGVGMLDNRYILGKVLLILAPPGRIGAIK